MNQQLLNRRSPYIKSKLLTPVQWFTMIYSIAFAVKTFIKVEVPLKIVI